MMRRTLCWLVNFEAVFMPALSPSMETGTVVEWKKKVGELVKENEVFCTIQTDKAVVDYTNTFEPGYLAKIYCQNGESASVAKTIAVMVDDPADVAKADEFTPEGEEPAAAAEEEPAAAPAAPAAAAPASAPAGGAASEPPEGVTCEAVFMPALSPSMESGTVVEWKKKVGELVKENEVFCTIQTDKAVVDYTNTFEPGYLAKIYCQNGEAAPVAMTIAMMVADEADVPKVANYYPEGAVGAPEPGQAAPAAPASAPAAAAPASAPAGGAASEPPEGVTCEAVFMPALSPSMESGTVVEWKKKVGELVKENEVFCTIQTDKAVVDYTNTFEPGYLAKIYCQNGEAAPVAMTIAMMVADEADVPKVANYYPEGAVGAPEPGQAAAPAAPAAAPKAAAPAAARPAGGAAHYGGSVDAAVAASGPSVIRIAAGLEPGALAAVVPSGKGGRYVKSDFAGQPGFDYNAPSPARAMQHHGAAAPAASAAAKPAAASRAPAAAVPNGDIYNVVLQSAPVYKSVSDTKLLSKLISTMYVPKPKAKKAAK